jgi:hypothetical protein
MRGAIISSEWFLTKKGLLGKVESNGYRRGITTVLRQLEKFNTYAVAYNTEASKGMQEKLLEYLKQWKSGFYDFDIMMEFFNKLEKTATEYLEQYRT